MRSAHAKNIINYLRCWCSWACCSRGAWRPTLCLEWWCLLWKSPASGYQLDSHPYCHLHGENCVKVRKILWTLVTVVEKLQKWEWFVQERRNMAWRNSLMQMMNFQKHSIELYLRGIDAVQQCRSLFAAKFTRKHHASLAETYYFKWEWTHDRIWNKSEDVKWWCRLVQKETDMTRILWRATFGRIQQCTSDIIITCQYVNLVETEKVRVCLKSLLLFPQSQLPGVPDYLRA